MNFLSSATAAGKPFEQGAVSRYPPLRSAGTTDRIARADLSLGDLARWLNPIVAGWMNYYGRFYRTEMWLRAVATDLLGDASYDEAGRAELLTLVADESEWLDRLVANLLSLSRIEAGALRRDRQAVAMDELAAHTVKRLDRLLGRRPVQLDLPQLPLVDGDYTQLEQVMTNLLELGSTAGTGRSACDQHVSRASEHERDHQRCDHRQADGDEAPVAFPRPRADEQQHPHSRGRAKHCDPGAHEPVAETGGVAEVEEFDTGISMVAGCELDGHPGDHERQRSHQAEAEDQVNAPSAGRGAPERRLRPHDTPSPAASTAICTATRTSTTASTREMVLGWTFAEIVVPAVAPTTMPMATGTAISGCT